MPHVTNPQKVLRLLLGLSLAVPILVVLLLPPGSERTEHGSLESSFVAQGGSAWVVRAPAGGDSVDQPSRSRLVLFENGAPLGPAHAPHADIVSNGGGRYSHWGEVLVFSTSDGSDPSTNGRVYSWALRVPALPSWVYWACLIIGGIGVYGAALLATKALPRTRIAIAVAILCGVWIEGGAALLLRDVLAGADDNKRQLFDRLFAGEKGIETREGEVLNYAPHPYLGFALNPGAAYGRVRQYNADYLIRRGEPIRARRDVDLRILVLGGSTTFGAGIPAEADTWVKLLEIHLRTRLGSRVDVINGGVGGYNIVENAIHYLLLLQQLNPNVVILVTGVNDVHARLIGELRSDYSNSRMVWNDDAHSRLEPISWLRWSYAYRLLIWYRIHKGREGHIYSVVQRPYPDIAEWLDQLKRNGPGEYERYLSTFVRLLRAEGRNVVIVPQPWRSRPGNKSDEYFGIGVSEHNAIGARVAAQLNIPFVTDADNPTFIKPHLFWDAVHFNAEGSRVMARLMADWICGRPGLGFGNSCRNE